MVRDSDPGCYPPVTRGRCGSGCRFEIVDAALNCSISANTLWLRAETAANTWTLDAGSKAGPGLGEVAGGASIASCAAGAGGGLGVSS
jgi:hypothetical protein